MYIMLIIKIIILFTIHFSIKKKKKQQLLENVISYYYTIYY